MAVPHNVRGSAGPPAALSCHKRGYALTVRRGVPPCTAPTPRCRQPSDDELPQAVPPGSGGGHEACVLVLPCLAREASPSQRLTGRARPLAGMRLLARGPMASPHRAARRLRVRRSCFESTQLFTAAPGPRLHHGPSGGHPPPAVARPRSSCPTGRALGSPCHGIVQLAHAAGARVPLGKLVDDAADRGPVPDF